MPGPWRTAIVTDNPALRQVATDAVREQPLLELQPSATVPGPALGVGLASEPDLLIVDVGPSKPALHRLLAGPAAPVPAIILVARDPEDAALAFQLRAVAFLRWPCGRERLDQALVQALGHLQATYAAELSARVLAMLDSLGSRRRSFLQRVGVEVGGRFVFVRFAEVDWIGSAGNYVELHCGSRTHLLRSTMRSLEGELDPQQFTRIHRSVIVNVDRISELQPAAGGDYRVLLQTGVELPMSRRYRHHLPVLLGKAS